MANYRLLVIAFAMFLSCVDVSAHLPNPAVRSLELVGLSGSKAFYTVCQGNVTWMEAQEICNQAEPNMNLAQLETSNEIELVLNYFKSESAVDQFWLSATDFGSEGEFHWTKLGNPVTEIVHQSGVYQCLKIQDNGFWFDESCAKFSHERLWPLCEKERLVEATTTQKPIEPTTTQKPIETTTTQKPIETTPTKAPFTCTSVGTFPDPDDCTMYHVCVRHQGGFIDYEMRCPEFTNYCVEEQVCGHIDDCPCDSGAVDLLNFSKTYKRRPILPKASFTSVGKVGSKSFYTAEIRNLNWIEAIELCHENGMMLGRMESEAERTVLLSYLNIFSGLDYFWLSGVDYGAEGDYYWLNSGVKLNTSIYGNGGRASNCVYLAGIGPLYDWSCENNKRTTLWPLCQLVEI